MEAQGSKKACSRSQRKGQDLKTDSLVDLPQIRPGQGRAGDSQVTHRRKNGGILGKEGRVCFLDFHGPLSLAEPSACWHRRTQPPGPAPSSPYLTLFQAVRNFALNLSTSSGSPGAAADEPRAGPLAPEDPRPLGSETRGPRGLRPSGWRASSGLPLPYCTAAGDMEFMGARDRGWWADRGPGWGPRASAPGARTRTGRERPGRR